MYRGDQKLRRPTNFSRRIWKNEIILGEDNIKIYRKDISYEGVHWIYVAENRVPSRSVVNTTVNFWAP
jgi:hypothetical protein